MGCLLSALLRSRLPFWGLRDGGRLEPVRKWESCKVAAMSCGLESGVSGAARHTAERRYRLWHGAGVLAAQLYAFQEAGWLAGGQGLGLAASREGRAHGRASPCSRPLPRVMDGTRFTPEAAAHSFGRQVFSPQEMGTHTRGADVWRHCLPIAWCAPCAAGDRVDYLPVGEDMLPIIYFVSSRGCLSVVVMVCVGWGRGALGGGGEGGLPLLGWARMGRLGLPGWTGLGCPLAPMHPHSYARLRPAPPGSSPRRSCLCCFLFWV